MKADLETLRALPLLRSFPDDLLAALNETADLVRFAPEKKVFKAGERLSHLHYLLSGSIGATRQSLGEEDDLVDVLLPVQPLCLPAVLLDLPAPVGAYTLATGHLITLSASRLRKVIASDARLTQPFLDCALQQAHEQALELRDLKLRSTAQRLAGYLLGFVKDPEEEPARFVLPFKKELVAAKIGCTQEHLSRAFATLREIGVQTWLGAVILHDLPALRAFSHGSGRPTQRGRHSPFGVQENLPADPDHDRPSGVVP
jgi:CRP-like cAMP-binding protein